ncbi:hypothetical protein EON63_00070 [archaeon]|nr:MAG: hypothetical protein EON63_00070 [archaeon]
MRYDSKDASMVEENPLVVLPGKVYGKVYMNIDKPPPTVLTEGVVIGVGVEIGLGLGMGMEGDYSHVFEVDSHVDLPVKK